MAFTDTQTRQLKRKLDAKHVKTRNADGAILYYVEGWHVIAEANRIFGFDAWDRRTLSTSCVWTGMSGSTRPPILRGFGCRCGRERSWSHARAREPGKAKD